MVLASMESLNCGFIDIDQRRGIWFWGWRKISYLEHYNMSDGHDFRFLTCLNAGQSLFCRKTALSVESRARGASDVFDTSVA